MLKSVSASIVVVLSVQRAQNFFFQCKIIDLFKKLWLQVCVVVVLVCHHESDES